MIIFFAMAHTVCAIRNKPLGTTIIRDREQKTSKKPFSSHFFFHSGKILCEHCERQRRRIEILWNKTTRWYSHKLACASLCSVLYASLLFLSFSLSLVIIFFFSLLLSVFVHLYLLLLAVLLAEESAHWKSFQFSLFSQPVRAFINAFFIFVFLCASSSVCFI